MNETLPTTMAISNCLFSATFENVRGFSNLCILAKSGASPGTHMSDT